jgi:membrane protein DedA with SNARE-associated domain
VTNDRPDPEDVTPETRVEQPKQEPQWWDDPRMPWGHQPSRADLWCFGAITVLGLYSLALLPFRAVLLTQPFLAATLTGSRTGVVMIGALTATGQPTWWPFWLVVAVLSVMKFDLIYFWAGRLWGQGIFEMVAGKSARARRNAERAEKFAKKYAVPALFVTYLPIPLPAAVIYATLGAAGMTWRKFIAFDLLFAAIVQALYFYLGFQIGAPAVEVVAEYGKYMWYLALAILVGMIVTFWWSSRRKRAETV